MHTKKIVSTLGLLIAVLGLSIGVSYVAAAWSEPTGTPPANNLYVPVNATQNAQAKQSGLSVNTFAALGNGSLQQDVFFKGQVKGINPGSLNTTLRIGGVGTNGPRRVFTTINGNVTSQQTLGSSELINTTMNTLCADDTGQVVFCTTTTGSIAHLTIKYNKSSGNFVATLDQPIGQDLTIQSVTSTGYANAACVNVVATANRNTAQVITAGQTTATFAPVGSPATTGTWSSVTNQTISNFMVNGVVRNNGDSTGGGSSDVVIFDTPPCS